MSQFSQRSPITLPIVFTFIFSLGCNKVSTTSTDNGDLNKQAVVVTDKLSCLATTADYELTTDITAFEMTSSNSVSVGFSLKGLLKALGVGISYSSGNLSMNMSLFEPLKKSAPLIAAPGAATFKKIKFDISVSAWLADLSLNHYKKTALSDLTQKALEDGMTNVDTKLFASEGAEPTWTTVVSRIIDADNFLVPVGTQAHLKVGDKFGIYNIHYEWENPDAPCSSGLLMSRRLSKTPIAIATIQQIDTNSAYLQVTKRNTDEVIQNYAQLVVEELKSDADGKTRSEESLAHSIHIGTVSQGQPLQFETDNGVQDVDLTPYVTQQVKSIVSDPAYGGFYLR